MRHNSDRDWEVLGKQDPYWAVLTYEIFRGLNISDTEKLEAFLASGSEHVATLWHTIESHFGPIKPQRALDFGCGVGRVAIPLGERCGRVLGVDVADSMLAHARELCGRLNVMNVRFAKTDDRLAGVEGTFDLVHSYIVFQHIPPRRGLQLLKQLIGRLNENGVAAIHVMYHNPDMAVLPTRVLKRTWRWLKRPFRDVPQMQMNSYSISEVFRIVQSFGIREIHILPTDHGGCLGVMLLFRRITGATYALGSPH